MSEPVLLHERCTDAPTTYLDHHDQWAEVPRMDRNDPKADHVSGKVGCLRLSYQPSRKYDVAQ